MSANGVVQPGFAAFGGPEAKTQLRSGCYPQGLMLKGVVTQGLVLLPIARHPGFSTLVTLCIWPRVPTLLTLSYCLLETQNAKFKSMWQGHGT